MIAAIVYTSATGFTRRYARMLGEETGLPVYDAQSRSVPPRGTEIVYLGWLMAGSVKGLARARRQWNVRAVCAVGMAPAQLAEGGLRDRDRLGAVPLFYLQGGYAPEKLTGINRVMMGMMTRKITASPPKGETEAAMQAVFRSGADFVRRESLDPVLDWLRDGRLG